MKKERNVILTRTFMIHQVLEFVNMAGAFDSNICVCRKGKFLNGKGLLGIVTLFLTLQKGDSVLLMAEGCDAELALDRLSHYMMFVSDKQDLGGRNTITFENSL